MHETTPQAAGKCLDQVLTSLIGKNRDHYTQMHAINSIPNHYNRKALSDFCCGL